MKFWKILLWLIAAILFIEVIKSVIAKSHFASSFLWQTVLSSLSFFLFFGFLLHHLLKGRLKKTVGWRVLIVVVCFGLLELITVALLRSPDFIPVFLKSSFDYYYDYYDQNLLQYEKGKTVYDPDLFYRLRPLTQSAFNNREYRTSIKISRAGFRDDDSSVQNPTIVCFGDSYTFGWGVEEDECFPARLEKMAGKKVLNMGVPSYGTVREFKQGNRVDTANVKYLVIQYCHNDFGENLEFVKGGWRVSDSGVFSKLQNDHQLNKKYYPGKHSSTIGTILIKKIINKIYPVFRLQRYVVGTNDSGDAQAATFLHILKWEARRFTNIPIILIDIDKDKNKREDFLNHVSKFAPQNLHVLNMGDKLVDDDYFVLDQHLKASGHLKIAEAIKKKIDQLEADKFR